MSLALALLAFGSAACADSGTPTAGSGLTGTVTGPSGPEVGVWVIAETRDLATPFARIVVTDDEGRYLIPDLPEATYDVWVRGYGLVDSHKTEASPGAALDLTAVPAPDEVAAAHYYPAGYWLSLIEAPGRDEFPGTGPSGNGISPDIRTQADWLRRMKSGNCTACHQLGTLGTRRLPEALGQYGSSLDAWERRVLSGQAGSQMMRGISQLGVGRALQMFADWTDRIEAGDVPPAPPRPEGLERNVVITVWDWADPTAYLHDVVSTDRRDPTINAYGPVYGALELSKDYTPVLDPRTHSASQIPLTVRDPSIPPAQSPEMAAPSIYFGDEPPWDGKTNVHNPMIDGDGRVWLTARVRGRENPAFCREGSDHPSARRFPVDAAGRHLGVLDPRTGEYTHISTCFSTHHLMFAMDEDNTLWTSGGGQVVGWLNTRRFLETGDEAASQGWTPLVLDTNGNGVRDAYVEPADPLDPTMDKRIVAGFYAVAPAPDGSVWASSLGYPGAVVRLEAGDRPEETALAEYYELPLDENGEPIEGFSPRGMDVDRNGVAWVALASGHMGRFDRTLCRGPLNGPGATGQHCPEGWSFYREPLPQIGGVDTPGSAEASYYTWVDWWGALGLGENVPINTGNASEGLLVWNDGEWVVLRVPYPLGFYTKWMDGRIDDPDAGWKGRGVWTTISTRAPFHMEGGQGTTSKVIKFQMRPDPLAN
jgi:streptogramin lyase